MLIKSADENNLAAAMSVQKELMHQGYMLTNEAMDMLIKADLADIVDFQKEVVSFLKEIKGDGNYVSLYGNFP